MTTSRPAAHVLGRIDLVRALGRGGIPSIVAARGDDPIRYSRFVVGVIDADSSLRADALVASARGLPERPPLFYDSDESLLFVSRNRDRLGEAYRFVLPDAELVDDLLDKGRFQALAERLALPTPRARPLLAPDMKDLGRLGLRYPIVIKASPYRDKRWEQIGVAAKVLRVETEVEMEELMPRIAGAGIDVVAQELIPGPEGRVESYHVYVDESGGVAGEFTGRKIRTAPREFGMSTALVTTDDGGLAELGREIVRRLEFRGVAKLDFKRDAEGQLHLLEINPRFTLWAHVGAVAGVNLPALAYADLTGRARPPASRARAGVRWIWPRADAAAAREDGVSFAAWLRWALRSETNAAFALSDPAPYVWGRLGRPLLARVGRALGRRRR